MLRIPKAAFKLGNDVFIRFIENNQSGEGGYLFTFLLMLFALFLRYEAAPINAGVQYVTFFPSVAIAAIRGGFKQGMFACVLGLIFATYFFTPPYFSIGVPSLHFALWSNFIFLIDGLVISYAIQSMHDFRRKYAKELIEAQYSEKRVKAINKELDEFTYIASHDLKEPLRGIHNYSSFLKEDYADKLDDQGREYIGSIQRLTERMTMLIDKLLAYSRLGSTEIHKTTVDLDSIVQEVIADLVSIKTDGVDIRRINSLGLAQGDSMYIGEVFQNLITNAAKFNDKTEKWVEIGCDHSKANPVYFVRDNGIGIKPEHQESVFRIFKRLHEQNKYGGGTGAGLTIVKKIIERQGGHIWLESSLGVGTTFYFTLRGEG